MSTDARGSAFTQLTSDPGSDRFAICAPDGSTTDYFASFGPPVYSVEVNPRHAAFASMRLARKRDRVHLFEGSSPNFLRGLTTVISNATGLDVKLADDPLTCVARGTSVYLENLELWKDTMESDEDDF